MLKYIGNLRTINKTYTDQMTAIQPEKQQVEEGYNVFCHDCGEVFMPRPQSPLWWKAKQFTAANPTRLDCMSCDGEECGCVTKKHIHKPEAPYRVFGYNGDCEDFDIPCDNFVQAVKIFRERDRFDIAFCKGVSNKVLDRIKYGF